MRTSRMNIETWFEKESAAQKFIEMRREFSYRPSKSGKGFIVFRKVKGTYNEEGEE